MRSACAIGARPSRVLLVTGVLFIWGAARIGHAQPVIDLNTGAVQTVLSPDHQPWALGINLGAGVRVPVSDEWRLRFHVNWRRLWNDTTTNAVVKLPKPDDRAARAWTQAALAVAAERRLPILEPVAPFAGLGIGLLSWEVTAYPGYEAIRVESGDGTMRDYTANELYVLGAVGIEPRLFSNVRLRVEAGVNMLTGLGTDFADHVHDDRSHAQLTIAFGLAIPLGGSAGHIPPAGPVIPPRFSADTAATTPPVAISAPPARPEPATKRPLVDTTQSTAPVVTKPAEPKQQMPAPGTREPQPLIQRLPTDTTRAESSRQSTNPAPTRTEPVAAQTEPSNAVPDTEAGAPSVSEEDSIQEGIASAEMAVVTPDLDTDSDGDGVPDYLDACPDTPRLPGLAVDERGCPVDTDRDGVPDYLDACPGTARGIPVDDIGCPRDTDKDGIPDYLDRCPDTPAGVAVDSTGCLVMTQLDRRLILHVIYVSGTTDPDPMSLRILDDLAVRLKASPKTEALIEGFTDDIGDALANLNVSQKRANKIKEHLIRRGVPSDRLNAIGRGESRFIASNETAAGREKNRRIEISFRRGE